MDYDWRVKITDVGYKLEKDIYIFRKLSNGKIDVLGVGEIEDGIAPKPTLSLTDSQLQEFADVLAQNGFKPLKGFLEGKLNATEKHLEDMRTLVFKKK